MNDQEYDSEKENDASDDDVADAQKGVFTAQQWRRWNDNSFTSSERLDRISCKMFKIKN